MRVLIALSSFLLGTSLADNLINKLIPDIDFDNEDCIGDACFLRNQLLSVDRQKTDPTTGLVYNERSLAYANTQSLLPICLPNVAKEAAADSFDSCNDRKMEDICVFTKRGWLVKDDQNESVTNLNFLKTAFSGLPGGVESVKKCLKLKEEAEADDYEYEYYDYADYYDEYDYLEEGEGVERRIRREAGNGNGNGKKGKKGKKGKGKGKDQARKGRKNKKGGKKKNGKNTKNNKGARNGKSQKKSGNKPKNNGKGQSKGKKKGKGRKSENGDSKKKSGKSKGKKNGKGKNDGKADGRKFVKNPSKKPSTEDAALNTAKITARLNKLGLSKLPAKSTLDGLECMWDELEDLLVKCGEKIISNSP